VYTRSPFALWTAGFTPPALPSAASQPQLRASSQSAGGRKRLCEGGEQLEVTRVQRTTVAAPFGESRAGLCRRECESEEQLGCKTACRWGSE